jgi:AcrR family transcriptional regulator
MSSQKSSVLAVEPKRQRGRDRVAAIIDAAAAVFTEKGYEAATMTEIAARAGAAIGSLYRFFPTKEALGDALIAHYGASLIGAFAEIEARAGEMSPMALAGALIDVMQSHEPARAAAIALIDARGDAAEVRSTLRAGLRERIAGIVAKIAPGVSPARTEATAVLLLHVLKLLRTLLREQGAANAELASEGRALVARYLAGIGVEPESGA